MALTGTAGFEFLQGTPDPDIIRGLEGNDTLGGMEGDDNIQGNQGNDQLVGDEGNDILFGGMDNDILYGNQDEDSLSGDQGSDSLFGGRGNDSLWGQQDDDSLWGNLGSDILYGGRGNDWLFGGQENDSLFGDLGNDILFGGKGNDSLYGGEGNDSLFGDLGSDTVTGGDGSDIFVVAVIGDGTSEGDEVTDADLFADFMLDEDSIGLDGGLTFEDLEFEEVTEGIAIVHSETGSYLAVVQQVTLDQLDNAANFVIAPTLPTGQQQKPTISDPVLPETPDRPPIGPIVPVEGNEPTAIDDSTLAIAGEAVTINVLGNDSDPDNDEISIVGFPQTTEGGTVTIDNSGTPFDPTDDTLVYTAAADFTGTESYTYTISDGSLTDTAAVTVTVERRNVAPVATNDEATTTEGIAATISVLDNDFDINGDPLSIAGAPATTELGATLDIDDDVLVYELAELSETTTDSFTYTISDGDLMDTATVTVIVEPGNEPPSAVEDSIVATEGIATPIVVLDNDSDPNGDEISLTDFPTSTTESGIITLDRNGTFLDLTDDFLVYTSASGFTGTDSFTYTISDGELTDTATVTVTVEPVPNEAPIAEDDTATATEGTPATIAVLDNDSDPENAPLAIAGLSETTAGGAVSLDGETVIYTPPAVDPLVTDSFTYTLSDGELTDTATVTVTVEPDNQPPIAEDDTATATEGTPATIAVLDNDSDPENAPLAIAGLSETTAGGAVSLDGETVIYTPPAVDALVTDSFTYTLSDGELTDTATVTVTVEPDNQPPIAEDDQVMVMVNQDLQTLTIPVLLNDSDPNAGDTITVESISTPENGGTVTIVNDNQQVQYTPSSTFTGDTDSFLYTITDSQGETSAAMVTINFEPDDDALNGTDSNDLLIASDRGGDNLESQRINGDAGDDIIISGVGPKILDGGEGADTFVYGSLETTTMAGDTIINFDPRMDRILLDFEVSPGTQVVQGDVAIGTFGVPGFFTIGLNNANTEPDFMPENFVIGLSVRSGLEQTTEDEIRDSIEFGTV
ncbi:MAG: tandem-95 repeat protein [Hormoscilla sp. GUM202]|nr:tandem-95 repeat protein [Hormoscilla sp. GUM202]